MGDLSDLVFSSTCSGYERWHPRMSDRHRVAGLPMISHADCRLLESLVTERMKTATGDDLDRLIRWHHAIVHTRAEAAHDGWPGWEGEFAA